jgi:hypothetical protein
MYESEFMMENSSGEITAWVKKQNNHKKTIGERAYLLGSM